MKLLMDNKRSIISNLKYLMLFLRKPTSLVFIVCSLLLVRWCSLPIADSPLLKVLFLGEGEGGDIALGLVCGYVSGFFVYVLTVVLPNWKKTKPMQELAALKLYSFYRNTILTLLLMYKSECSKEEWDAAINPHDSDLKCFTEEYFSKMQTFNVLGSAYTLIKHKGDGSDISWIEYLSLESKSLWAGLDRVALQYHEYLDRELIDVINGLMTSGYLELLSGNHVKTEMACTGEDGYTYFDGAPISAIYQPGENWRNFFSSTNMLEQYFLLLQKLYLQLERMPKEFSLEKDFAIKRLKGDRVGRLKTIVLPQSDRSH